VQKKYLIMGLKTYIQEAFNELFHKVSWPTWKELQSSAIIVMVATLIIAIILLIMDSTFSHIMQDVVYKILE